MNTLNGIGARLTPKLINRTRAKYQKKMKAVKDYERRKVDEQAQFSI